MKSPANIFQQIIIGLQSYLTAFTFIVEKKLWVYFVYPILVGVLLIYSIFSASTLMAEELEILFSGFIAQYGTSDVVWITYMISAISAVITFGFKTFIFFVLSMLSKYLVLIVMSPMMAILSEKVEEIETGIKQPFQMSQLISDVLRGVRIALRNLLLETGVIILCLLLALFPPLALITAPFLMILSWYFYGFSMIDYSNERHHLSVKESIQFVRQHKGLAIVNGAVFSTIFSIPFVGVILASVLSPVAATLAVLEVKK